MYLHRSEEQFYLSRFIFLRALGFVYFIAFLCLYNDVLPLLGSKGLLPADLYLDKIHAHFGDPWSALLELPSLFHYAISDGLLKSLSFLGILLSLLVTLGFCNALILLALWALYFSFVSIGQTWYSFGWESQLLETGLLAVFLVPLFSYRPFSSPPPKLIIALSWWLIFRIMLGAGLIKLRGDDCWTELTCLYDHFETQPVPNPLSILFHYLPAWCLKLGTLFNHIIELFIPFLLLAPRKIRNGATLLMIFFQGTLIASGNLAFLNWLTILPCLLCIDDSLWKRILPFSLQLRIPMYSPPIDHRKEIPRYLYAGVVIYLSIPVIQNLFSAEQSMNRSFNPLRVVNTYGAFGSVESVRTEVIIEGQDQQGNWLEYEFKCKPGSIDRRPCWISPYHYRLDWLIWFAGIEASYGQGLQQNTWAIHLVWKLLHNDSNALQLLEHNPFPESPPIQIRLLSYEYHFDALGAENWWLRHPNGIYLPALNKNTPELIAFIQQQGWQR